MITTQIICICMQFRKIDLQAICIQCNNIMKVNIQNFLNFMAASTH